MHFCIASKYCLDLFHKLYLILQDFYTTPLRPQWQLYPFFAFWEYLTKDPFKKKHVQQLCIYDPSGLSLLWKEMKFFPTVFHENLGWHIYRCLSDMIWKSFCILFLIFRSATALHHRWVSVSLHWYIW